tara:strand:+ start:9517 stop:10968 length:1452 start_codon:yes stop_codon:yes gene_type:complete
MSDNNAEKKTPRGSKMNSRSGRKPSLSRSFDNHQSTNSETSKTGRIGIIQPLSSGAHLDSLPHRKNSDTDPLVSRNSQRNPKSKQPAKSNKRAPRKTTQGSKITDGFLEADHSKRNGEVKESQEKSQEASTKSILTEDSNREGVILENLEVPVAEENGVSEGAIQEIAPKSMDPSSNPSHSIQKQKNEEIKEELSRSNEKDLQPETEVKESQPTSKVFVDSNTETGMELKKEVSEESIKEEAPKPLTESDGSKLKEKNEEEDEVVLSNSPYSEKQKKSANDELAVVELIGERAKSFKRKHANRETKDSNENQPKRERTSNNRTKNSRSRKKVEAQGENKSLVIEEGEGVQQNNSTDWQPDKDRAVQRPRNEFRPTRAKQDPPLGFFGKIRQFLESFFIEPRGNDLNPKKRRNRKRNNKSSGHSKNSDSFDKKSNPNRESGGRGKGNYNKNRRPKNQNNQNRQRKRHNTQRKNTPQQNPKSDEN